MSVAKTESTGLLQHVAPEGALDDSGVVDIWSFRRIGYLMQYFSVGIVYGGLPATVYGVFIAYLNVPAYVANAASTLATFPWSLKVLFALITDMFPICGYRRRPWMVIGWSVTTVFLVALALVELPDPYFCTDDDGRYDLNKVCNEDASDAGTVLAILMALCACGYVQADVAADALTVQYGRREPKAIRGRTQTTAYMVREFGIIFALLIVGLGMNGKEYSGDFDNNLSFNQVCAVFAIPSAIMVPVSWWLIEENKLGPEGVIGTATTTAAATATSSKSSGSSDRSSSKSSKAPLGAAPLDTAAVVVSDKGGRDEEIVQEAEPVTLKEYSSLALYLMSSAALFEVICYQFFATFIGSISTTAGNEVQLVWAKVQNLQLQLFGIGGHVIFAAGLYVTKAKFLNVSWRWMLAFTLVVANVIDIPFTFLTIFDVVRNQYFFLDDGLITSLPASANFVVSTYVMVEIAETGTEGVTYGLLTTAANMGGPVANGLSNWIFSYFSPSLSDATNYVEDEQSFRRLVSWSYVLTYIFSFSSLLLLPLLPNQKDDAQYRKRTRPRALRFAVFSIVLITVALIYALTVDFLSIFPSTACLKVAGGTGC